MAEQDVAAAGGELGELFEYKLKQPVTIRRNQSAMVPVVQHDVTVERVSLWSAARGVAQPLRAVWLTNDTGLTLDGGSLTLVEGGAFAGEGLVEPIKPGEKRFVSYAVDLGVRVTVAPQDSGRRVSRIRIASSVMTQSIEERASTLYTVRNDDATPRDVVIEHPVRAGWTLTSGVKPAESSATAHRFRVAVAPKSTATLTVAEMRPIDRRSRSRTSPTIRSRSSCAAATSPPAIEPQLRAIAAKSRELARGAARHLRPAGRGAAHRRGSGPRPREPEGAQGQRRREGADRALHAPALGAGGSARRACARRWRPPRPTVPRNSRSCRGWWRRCRWTSSCREALGRALT